MEFNPATGEISQYREYCTNCENGLDSVIKFCPACGDSADTAQIKSTSKNLEELLEFIHNFISNISWSYYNDFEKVSFSLTYNANKDEYHKFELEILFKNYRKEIEISSIINYSYSHSSSKISKDVFRYSTLELTSNSKQELEKLNKAINLLSEKALNYSMK